MRDLTAAVQAALAADQLRLALLYEGAFSGGTLRLWTGVGDLSWNGYTWTGAGNLLGISEVQETADVRATGLAVSLSGMPSTLLSTVLQNARHGYTGTVWFAFFTAAGALIADPAIAFKGRLDVPSFEERGDGCTIVVNYESRLIDLDRARDRRYTHEDQQIDYPGDLGFEYVPAIQDAQINWGIAGGAPVIAK